MNDHVDLSTSTFGVPGAAYQDTSIRFDPRRDMGRALTTVESAALDECDRITELKETCHALWLTQLSPKEKRRLGLVTEEHRV